MFLGGSAGSTSGGIKVVRHLLMIKGGILEFKRALHPNAIIQPRYNGKIVNQEIIGNILAFFILYMISFIVGSLVFQRERQVSIGSEVHYQLSPVARIGAVKLLVAL